MGLGTTGSLTVGTVRSNESKADEPVQRSFLQQAVDLVRKPELENEIVINVNPLWADDGSAYFPSSGLGGVLVKSDPMYACSKVETHPEYPTFEEIEAEEAETNSTHVKTKWILLVNEGLCSIAEKMKHAENAGYSTLLLTSSDPRSDEDLTNISKRKIFAAKISIVDGITLLEKYVYPEPAAAKLEDIRDQQWTHAIYKIVGMVVAAIVIVAAIFGIITKALKIRKRWQEEKAAAELRETLRKTIETMPITIWELNQMTKDEKCHICYGLFYPNDIVRTMPCYHRFHQRCILSRFDNGNTECPVCHYQLLTNVHKKTGESTPLL